ncbi:T-cell-specific guanine nucleotide triphosphate-binding protein 2-like [Haliotis rubra]|uniref:T-cell-specific guanine nucleotide triphosphate-binding protein 2-like n=1 Tax=Haliotis rubra TaxID=36100 RepID=UPI001EE5466D|nr:T-cell-specific guanine nucleotide triphosphate-binding protein 2-like [Haliotis rubra]XP_046565335.1 T-cell-specific guanine nucleotide triphosphate-binding protein 2-like [Haliotis rubra]
MDDNSFEDITQDEIDEIRRHVDEHGLSGLPSVIQDKMREWQNVPLSIAVVGESGVGKSTFINSIRGLTADDEGSAEVGIGDTTQEPTMYRHPYNEKLVFWDLPGVGTPRFPQDKSYLGRVGYSQYDFFLLLSDDRFTSKDIWLAREIESLKKDYFFIRTKIDDAMENAEHSEQNFSESNILERIKKNCHDNFTAGQLKKRPVYCIDSYDKHKWDYTKLMEDILVSLPEQKRNALVLSLSPLTKGVIKSKTVVLKIRAKKVALISGIQGAGTSLVPIPLLGGAVSIMLDTALLVEEVIFYLKQYGLDDESLQELSSRTNTTVDYFRDALKGGSAIMASRQSVKTFVVNMIKSEAAEEAVKRIPIELARFLPFVSALVGGIANFATAYYMLIKMIDDLEKDAMKITDAVIKATSSCVD